MGKRERTDKEEVKLVEAVDFGGLSHLNEDEVPAFQRGNLAYLSDSSDEEDAPLVRVGNVPREWYDDLNHMGYNIDGVPITKAKKPDHIDTFLNKHDKSALYTIYDEDNDRYVKLSKEELETIRRIRKGQYPDAEFDEYDEKYWTDVKQTIHPIGNTSYPPKSRFIPSKWENKKILRILQALRNGWIKSNEEEEEELKKQDSVYLMWKEDGSANDDSESAKHRGPSFVPPKKEMTPGHAESYNPPEEFLMTQEEIEAWEQMDEEERELNFIPQKFEALRKVGAYDNYIKDRFERCLDLYLCTRKIKKKINIDPESLIPKLPDPSTLKPFPSRVAFEFLGHNGRVRSISVSPCGQWLASGGEDGTVKLWEVDSARLLRTFEFGEIVKKVSWNPVKERPLLACVIGDRVEILPTETSSVEVNSSIQQMFAELNALIKAKLDGDQNDSDGENADAEESDSDAKKPRKKNSCEWSVQDLKGSDGLKKVVVRQSGIVTTLSWHSKGDYFVSTRSDSVKQAVVVHRLTHGQSQAPFTKNKGQVQAALFHPSKPHLFVITKTHIRLYDLSDQSLLKKVITPIKWISSADVHPSGDHLIIGGYDRRVCWYDMDLTSQPYKNLKYHSKGVRKVQFHPRYPLFASCSDDGKVHVFHGRVYNDLMESPSVVPLKIIKAHAPKDDLGVLDCCYHPSQPWIFTAGADGIIKLFNQ
jgi:ribosome biogenesis protein ERB1